MIYNYHTHTFRCHHAEGTEREYIERAISGGIKKMGFSEHIPFDFPDGYRSYWRMFTEDVADYFETLRALREEYKDRIEVFIGFEMEYYPLYFEQMKKNAIDWGAEYLILGQHYTKSEYPAAVYSGFPTPDEEQYVSYVDNVVSGLGTGLFTYVAHPDLFKFTGSRSVFRRETERLCAAAKESGTPLEINLLGIRTGRNYPNPDFWQIAGETGCSAVLGCDAHSPLDAYDAESIPKARSLAEKFGVYIEEDPSLILLNLNDGNRSE